MDCDPGLYLCFKCSRSKDKLHPPTHHLVQFGYDWSPQPPSEVAASEGGQVVSEDLVLEQPMYEVDDDDPTNDSVADVSVVPE